MVGDAAALTRQLINCKYRYMNHTKSPFPQTLGASGGALVGSWEARVLSLDLSSTNCELWVHCYPFSALSFSLSQMGRFHCVCVHCCPLVVSSVTDFQFGFVDWQAAVQILSFL